MHSHRHDAKFSHVHDDNVSHGHDPILCIRQFCIPLLSPLFIVTEKNAFIFSLNSPMDVLITNFISSQFVCNGRPLSRRTSSTLTQLLHKPLNRSGAVTLQTRDIQPQRRVI